MTIKQIIGGGVTLILMMITVMVAYKSPDPNLQLMQKDTAQQVFIKALVEGVKDRDSTIIEDKQIIVSMAEQLRKQDSIAQSEKHPTITNQAIIHTVYRDTCLLTIMKPNYHDADTLIPSPSKRRHGISNKH